MQILQPPGWAPPKGYSNGIAADGHFIFVAGQVGTDSRMQLVGSGFVEQARQALENIMTVLKEGPLSSSKSQNRDRPGRRR